MKDYPARGGHYPEPAEANPASLLFRTLDPEERTLLACLRTSAPRLARLLAGDCLADARHSKEALAELAGILRGSPVGARLCARCAAQGQPDYCPACGRNHGTEAVMRGR